MHGTDLDELYDKADMAMYHAKKNKINAPVLFDETMNAIAFGKNGDSK